MLKVLVGEKLELPEKPLNYSNLNVYYMMELDDPMITPVDVEIQQGLDKVIKYFIEKGSRTVQMETKENGKFYDFRYSYFLWTAAMNDPTEASYLDKLTEGKRSSINPYLELIKCIFGNDKYTAAILALGIAEETGIASGDYKKDVYEAMLERLKKDLHELLGNNGVLLCPTFPEIGMHQFM